MIDTLNGNTPKYKEIINSAAKKLCVIAGPGSGKTKCVLVPKAKQLIADHKIDPEEVLLISFSRLSAQDLRERVKEFDRIPRAATLHSICLSFLLSEDNHDIRKRIETIVIDFERQIMLSDLKTLFPGNDKRDLKRMLDEFSAGWAVKPHDTVFTEDDRKKSFKAAVLNWLDEHEAAMMEEIVYHAVDLAKKLKANFIEKPQYIFVDEFQDLNKLEQEFVNLLGASSKLILVVGDPDQSIYSFKYAYPNGILDFARSEGVESHSLTYSGRCARSILNVANQLLKQANPNRTEYLKSPPDTVAGDVSLVQKTRQADESSFVFDSIRHKVKEGVEPKEIIVLVPRKKLGSEFVKYANAQQRPDGLTFKVVVKNDYSQIEQERILLLGIIANPNSILRIRSYVGLKDPNNYANEFAQLKQKYGNIRDAIQHASPDGFERRKRKVRVLCSQLQNLRAFMNQHKDAVNLVEIFDELLPPMTDELADLRNIFMELKEDSDTPKTIYSKFLDYSRTLPAQGNVVRIMTLLASKGLDADYVYIMGCNDGNIPGENRSIYLTDYEYKQEQRRLLFVGVTRAKKGLCISWSRNIPFKQSRGQYTRSIRTITLDGERYSQVGLSELLQDIDFSQ